MEKASLDAKDKMLLADTSTIQEKTQTGANGVGLDFNAFQRYDDVYFIQDAYCYYY